MMEGKANSLMSMKEMGGFAGRTHEQSSISTATSALELGGRMRAE